MYRFNNGQNVGEFTEKEYGKVFTYRMATSEFNVHDFRHEIDVLDGFRFATVKKTVAYVWVGDDENGKPITERWQIKNHVNYLE